MAKIDETKERISYLKIFLTITLGALVITIGGLVNLHLAGKIGLVFWMGIWVVAVFLYAAWRIMLHIEKPPTKLGEL
jgi:amino acid permease